MKNRDFKEDPTNLEGNSVSVNLLHPPEKIKQRNYNLFYGVDEVPPWYKCIFLGFQHYLTMFGSTVAIPLILAGPLGIEKNDVAKGQLISTIFFASGICTLLQTTFGNRLPIIQGGVFAFLAPTIAILLSIKFPIDKSDNGNSTANGSESGDEEPPDFWQTRIVQVQGAIMVASTLQIVLGFTGLIGFVMSRIGPLTIAPTITLVGLSLFGAAGSFAGKHWGISFMTMFFIILFSQYLKDGEISIPVCGRKRIKHNSIKIFCLFPVIFAVLLSWSISAIITAAGGFPSDPTAYGFEARTDIRLGVLRESPWFRVPYPGQWGLPIVTVSGVVGMISGVLASIIESIGDYYACARLCYIPAPPNHAMNRGIFIEGIGTMIAGALGSGNGTTSYSENIGAIGITKVGSRIVVQTGAVIMLFLAVIGKFGALFTTIPDPVVGGMFCVMFGIIAAVGISSLQYVDLNSSRNLLIMGFSTFMGITLPQWVKQNPTLINTGSIEFDQILKVLLETGMFIGGVLGFILDNTIPGTQEERGLIKWNAQKYSGKSGSEKDAAVYDFPQIVQRRVDKIQLFRYVPICTTFQTESQKKKAIDAKEIIEEDQLQQH